MEIKGYTFGYGGRKGDYLKDSSIESLDALCGLGVNWIALAFDVRIERCDSLQIRYDFNRDLSDFEITGMILAAHERNLNICLKPMINSRDHVWRAHINFGDDEGAWSKWFYEYTGYILHYAELAQRWNVEMLCLGCEMLGMERHEERWRELIAKVRSVYGGALTYNTNHGHEMDAKWYDAIDLIGTSGYYPVAKGPGASYEDMFMAWGKVITHLYDVSRKWDRPIAFLEAGCRSARGCAAMPWDYKMTEFPADEEEQAAFYASLLDAFDGRDWFAGVFWWDWSLDVTQKDVKLRATDFSTYGKMAATVVKNRYEAM